jgi:anti-sigma factor RsiW
MNNLERAQLMDAVLDGEATEAEARELARLLAADPAARTEFDQLRRLFDGLSRVPKAFPPEGLVAAVMANIPQNSPPQGRPDQLSLRSRVIGLVWMKARGTSPGKSATELPAHQPGIYLREWKMNEQNSSPLRKRNVLIGGAIAVAAALVALSYTIDFPPGAQNTVGTIVPAQRFHAAQPTAQEINVGGQSAAQVTPIKATSQSDLANQSTNSAVAGSVNSGVNNGTNNGVNSTVNSGVNNGTNNGVNSATNNGVNSATNNGVNSATNNGVNSGVNNGVNSATNSAVNNGVNSATNSAVNSGVNSATNSAVNSGVNNATNNGVNSAINNGVNNATNSATTR